MPDMPIAPIEIERLQGLVDLHQDILDHLPASIGVFDVVNSTTFRIAFANRVFIAASGRTRAEISGLVFSLEGPSASAIQSAKRMQACLESGDKVEIEDRFDLSHGTLWFRAVYLPIREANGQNTRILSMAEDITARKQREQAEQQRQAEIIEMQAATLAELSTPLLSISPTTVVMPLIGAVDTGRVQQIMETLLTGVQASGATTVIVDITGVPIVDTQVANALLQSAQAVKLLGAESVLTGIRPEVAQTLVQLGVDLRAITTRGTLQDGIAYALDH